MGTSEQLRVRVNDELVFDAGTCEEVSGPQGSEYLLRPPAATLFHQVLAYLQAKPDPPMRVFSREGNMAGSMVGRDGVAAAALILRWGSYLAVLLDHDKPVWPEVHAERTTRISKAKVSADAFAALADPTMANRLVQAVDPQRLARVRAEVAGHPSRVFANALVNVAWRNGPVEDIHAGSFQGYPITQRRVTPPEEKELMQSTIDGLALGLTVCHALAWKRPPRSWPEQVLPYGLATMMLVTPYRWTLTETSREVRLPLSPP
jgi:hypothetical protein